MTITFLLYFAHTFPCLRIFFVAEALVIRDTFRDTGTRLGGGLPRLGRGSFHLGCWGLPSGCRLGWGTFVWAGDLPSGCRLG